MKRVLTLVLLAGVGLLALILITQLTGSVSAEAECDYTHPLDEWKLDGQALGLQPGDTVCLGSGTRARMRIENVVGSAENPITIRNSGGQLIIDTDQYGIAIAKSKYLRLTGSGDPSVKYGIQASGTIGAGELSSNVEIDHIHVTDAGFAGFMVKTDPNCDPATWRANFTMYDVSLHDNYVSHTDSGEGFYVGFTFYDGYEVTCGGQKKTVYGHEIHGLEMYNNLIEDTGAEGLQVGSTPIGADIHHNIIRKFGQRPFADYQNNGVQIGAGTGGKFYNNWIEDGPGNGLMMMGNAENVIYNNVIVNTGESGVFCDERGTPTGNGYQFINNTIVNPGGDGIRIYADLVPLNHIKNNLIVAPGLTYIHKLNGNVAVDEATNHFASTLGDAKFVNAAANNFRPQPSSPAVDAGSAVTSYAIYTDFDQQPRPSGAGVDIGAYEYVTTAATATPTATLPPDVTPTATTTLPPGVTPTMTPTGTATPPPVIYTEAVYLPALVNPLE